MRCKPDSINRSGDAKETTLLISSKYGLAQDVKILLGHGADICGHGLLLGDLKNIKQHWMGQDSVYVSIPLENGDVLFGSQENIPLLCAINCDHAEVVLAFLERGTVFISYVIKGREHTILGTVVALGGISVLSMLLDRRINTTETAMIPVEDDQVTEFVLVAAASCRNPSTMGLLLDWYSVIKITEPVLVAAVTWDYDMELLLDRYSNVKITELVAAASIDYSYTILTLLNSNEEIKITAPVLMAATGNQRVGTKTMTLLLNMGREIKITEEVIMEAASNPYQREKILELLEDRGYEIKFDENVASAALESNRRKCQREILIDEVALKVAQSWRKDLF